MLVLAPLRDTEGKRDVTGAFLPEARALADRHGGTLRQIENTVPFTARRALSLREINRYVQERGALDAFAMCCHGWPQGVQLGFRIEDAGLLARALAQKRSLRTEPFAVGLLCCDTARDADADRADDLADGPGGIGGFADTLCEAIGNLGFHARVTAHATLGHTTSNPHVRVFDSADRTPGGVWIVPPRSPRWVRWTRALRDTDLRLRVPFMQQDAIERELDAIA